MTPVAKQPIRLPLSTFDILRGHWPHTVWFSLEGKVKNRTHFEKNILDLMVKIMFKGH